MRTNSQHREIDKNNQQRISLVEVIMAKPAVIAGIYCQKIVEL